MEATEARTADTSRVASTSFLTAADVETALQAGAAPMPRRGLTAWLKQHLIFVLTVLLPTLGAIVYYGLIASDVYTSESRFIVRSPQKPAQAGFLGEFLQGSGISRSQDDTYSVRDFILSRDALNELDAKLALREAYTRGGLDLFARFPTLDRDSSFEAFYRYYRKRVGVEFDPVSSISVLTVEAFSAADAHRVNALLLDMSERLVNSLNDRSRNDLIRFAEHEVDLAAEKSRDASLALLAYRSQQSVFEPDKQAAIQLEGVAKIESELVTTEAQIAQLKKLSPDNPQIIGLDGRADTLRAALKSEAAKVTSGNGSLSARAPTFERLALESTFADRQLGSALAALETARSEAARQQLYLERLVQPSLPDKAMEPRRVRGVFTVLLVGLIGWGVVSLLAASIREHVD
jgi:capsular polysaccharide transport system permease protein